MWNVVEDWHSRWKFILQAIEKDKAIRHRRHEGIGTMVSEQIPRPSMRMMNSVDTLVF